MGPQAALRAAIPVFLDGAMRAFRITVRGPLQHFAPTTGVLVIAGSPVPRKRIREYVHEVLQVRSRMNQLVGEPFATAFERQMAVPTRTVSYYSEAPRSDQRPTSFRT